MNGEIIEELMFDDSFTRSKLYFQTLQLLRLFSNLIPETGQDLDNNDLDLFTKDIFTRMRYCWGSEASKDIELLESNWEIVLKHHKELEKKLVSRIESKTAEVMSLRDGVSILAFGQSSKGLTILPALQCDLSAGGLQINLNEQICLCGTHFLCMSLWSSKNVRRAVRHYSLKNIKRLLCPSLIVLRGPHIFR